VSFDSALLDIICCPVTHQPLEKMSAGKLQRLNELIAAHEIRNRADEPVEAALELALVTRDGRLAYPVRDGIPMLLEEQGIVLTKLIDG